jgi:chromodomain-helicase-DNA-binding protein 7
MIGITGNDIKQRFVELTRLRRAFLMYNDQVMKEYFKLLPRWGNLPPAWTAHKEFVFFKEICCRGFGVCREILQMPAFDGIFNVDPPLFLSNDGMVLQRLRYIFDFLERTRLDTLLPRRQNVIKTDRRSRMRSCLDVHPAPSIAYNENGVPLLPIQFGSNAYVIELGQIVTDRPCFHTKDYIFPAGFKSSRLYASTLDPSQQVRYTSEILDTGGVMPLFRVTMDSHPEIFFEGDSPSCPWNLIAKRVVVMRGSDRSIDIWGQQYYGLLSPAVCYLIQQMDGADKCVNYVMRQFDHPKVE